MPQPRFVEVVDVTAEASSTIASLFASGQGLVGHLSFNVSDFIFSNHGRERLMSTLAAYNATPDWDDWQWVRLADSLNITRVPSNVPPPRGPARHLLLIGLVLVLVRELVLRWRVRCILQKYGHHA